MQDWSDNELDSNKSFEMLEASIIDNSIHNDSELCIQPPETQAPYVKLANIYNFGHIQKSWWLDNECSTPATCETRTTEEDKTPIYSEWAVMREILWMFKHSPSYDTDTPVKFVFFVNDPKSETVSINVDTTSKFTSVVGVNSVLNEFAEIFTMLYKLRSLRIRIFKHSKEVIGEMMSPITVQYYSNALKDFERSINDVVVTLEKQLIEQSPFEQFTLMWLYQQLLPQMQFFTQLFNIHTKVYVDYTTNAGNLMNKEKSAIEQKFCFFFNCCNSCKISQNYTK